MTSGRFAMAVHTLAVLAHVGADCTSEFIAGSVNTHAVFLRRILKVLVEAGLVQAREGRGGGYRLARPANRLTLAEVYRAVEGDGPLAPSPAEPNAACPVGSGMRRTFGGISERARKALLAELAGQTVADVVAASVRKRPAR